ncbi:hypothetical protein Adt_44871 [Abeliophyllum distichum]|uniref:Uncharacterized protein n=1 Tax=Abeliophyllum distichum TaxID=126358 RepID=A0ABD1PC43_9LAMI
MKQHLNTDASLVPARIIQKLSTVQLPEWPYQVKYEEQGQTPAYNLPAKQSPKNTSTIGIEHKQWPVMKQHLNTDASLVPAKIIQKPSTVQLPEWPYKGKYEVQGQTPAYNLLAKQSPKNTSTSDLFYHQIIDSLSPISNEEEPIIHMQRSYALN